MLSLYAKNVNDARGATDASGFGSSPNGAEGLFIIRPRTFGVTLSAAF